MGFLNLENFLWFQAGLVLFALFYLFRKNRPPLIRMRWGKSTAKGLEGSTFSTQGWKKNYLENELRASYATSAKSPESMRKVIKERNLNVYFNYNGHSWDAFEALGIPAGSSITMAEEAYNQFSSKGDPSAQEFYSCAMQAIRKFQK
ncbi:MAG: hypothetical protein K1X29_04725 [Bdellovibrionales bacterium]|nr:hypothetical protein [Bdellovibrionales bacterium]